MSLYDAIDEVIAEENKIAGKDVSAEEKVKANVEMPKEPEESNDEPPPAAGTDKGDAKPDDKNPKAAPADKAVGKDEKPKEGAEAAPGAADKEQGATPEALYKLRREAAAATRRAEAAEAALKQAPTQPQPGPATVKARTEAAAAAEPDPNLDPEAHLRWKLSKTEEQLHDIAKWKEGKEQEERKVIVKNGAVEAWDRYEKAFMPTVTDYEAVTNFGIQAIKQSIMTLNPNLTGPALGEAIQHQVLRLAAQAEQQGHDPAEYLYHQAKSWGYKPAPVEPTAEEKAAAAAADKAKPNITKIAEHKRRSASSLTGGGKSGAPMVSREQALSKDMTLAEWAKLTPGQLRELEQQEA